MSTYRNPQQERERRAIEAADRVAAQLADATGLTVERVSTLAGTHAIEARLPEPADPAEGGYPYMHITVPEQPHLIPVDDHGDFTEGVLVIAYQPGGHQDPGDDHPADLEVYPEERRHPAQVFEEVSATLAAWKTRQEQAKPTPTGTRFALDTDAARAWLELAERETEAGTRSEIANADEFALYASWEARWHDSGAYGPEIGDLIQYALSKGVLTRPADSSLDYEQDDDENETGYWWFVGVQAAGCSLRLNTPWEAVYHLGSPDARGAAAALAVLEEAVYAANGELDNLARYAAAHTPF